MTDIGKRDFWAFLRSRSGCIYLLLSLLALNIGFYLFNVLAGEADLQRILRLMPTILLFGVPFLTAAAFSGDFTQGIDKLWLVSPRSLGGIAAGKFLGCFGVFLVLLAPTLLWLPAAALLGGELNPGGLFGIYLGLICTGMAYVAVGIFFSSCNNHTQTAAASCFAFFAFVRFLESAAVLYPRTPLWLSTGLHFISVQARFDRIVAGFLSPADFLYMLSVCFFFLLLTGQNLEKRLWA